MITFRLPIQNWDTRCIIYLHIAITYNMNISVTLKSMNKKGQSLQSLWVPTFIMHKNRYL